MSSGEVPMTNEKLADNFIKTISDESKKYKTSFYLLSKGKLSKDDADDFYTETLLKCYNTITKHGFNLKGQTTETAYYGTYFTNALKNNLYQHLKKKNKENKAEANITLDVLEFDDEESFVMQAHCYKVPHYEMEYVEDNHSQYAEDVKEIKLKNAYEQLPVKFREILDIKFYDNIKYREISKVLGIPITTVKTRLNQARKLLKKLIKENESAQTR